MARKILNHYPVNTEGQGEESTVHFPVLDVLERSLSAIREIDPEQVHEWGPSDRLEEGVTAVTPPEDGASFDQLMETIRENGQQVPILIRPSKHTSGQFEVIYGRRRLRACRELGILVKANVQEMDDETALLAKGLENAARRNLSFYEKALFADQIIKAGNTAAKAGEVIGVSRTAIMNLTRITKTIPQNVGVKIGPAPTAGRPKWQKLAEAFEAQEITADHALDLLDGMDELTSDQRLDQLLKEISKRGAQSRVSKERSPVKGVKIKTGQGISVSIQKGPFADWLDQHLDAALRKAHEDFEATGKEE